MQPGGGFRATFGRNNGFPDYIVTENLSEGGTTRGRGSRIFDSEKTVIHPSLDDAVPRRLSIIVAAIATAASLTLLPKRPKDVGLAGDYPILRGRNQEPRRG